MTKETKPLSTTLRGIPDNATVRVGEDETYLDACLRSIERRTGARVYVCRLDSWREDGSKTYQLTLVDRKPVAQNSWSVAGEGWLYV